MYHITRFTIEIRKRKTKALPQLSKSLSLVIVWYLAENNLIYAVYMLSRNNDKDYLDTEVYRQSAILVEIWDQNQKIGNALQILKKAQKTGNIMKQAEK